ncbi:MAG: class I SAM-dependent methyltransferase [Gemmatimonadota bacterium]|nr:class I SAM-dependent methyltransferase [Gemmatimonadota bacterium]
MPESVKEFPGPKELGEIFEASGFKDVGWKLLSGGIAALHWGVA